MILAEVRSYLAHQGPVSLDDVANHFDMDPSAARGMLEHWIRKGKARRYALTDACGVGCSRCDASRTEIYEWTGGGAAGEPGRVR